MDFELGTQADALRARLRALVQQHFPPTFLGAFTDDPGDLALTEQFCRLLAEQRLLCLTWPVEYGGNGGTVWEQTVVREEMWAAHEPRGPQYMGVNWVGPALIRHGSAAQREQHLPPIARGEAIWCQGFSEPEAGSDLASLRTRAERQPDGSWRVTGQKVWTSYATMAQWCVLAACTDPRARTSARLSLFLIPMDRPGIQVRPIPAMLGPHHLNEVFFDDVEVRPDEILGDEGDGWAIMRDALAYERVGIARYARCESLLERIRAELGEGFAALPETLLARWARAKVELRSARLLAYAAVAHAEEGIEPAAASAARIATTLCDQAVAELLMDILGPDGLRAGADAPVHGAVEDHWRYAQAATVASGTIEVQKMLVARQVLGGR